MLTSIFSPLRRFSTGTTGLALLFCLAACQSGGGVEDAPELPADPPVADSSAAPNEEPAPKPKPWKLQLGDSVQGQHAVTVGEGQGGTREVAEELARANAQHLIASIRQTQVKSLSTISSSAQSGPSGASESESFEQNISLSSAMTIGGGVWGKPEVRQVAEDRYQVRIQFKVPNRLVRPANHLRQLSGAARVRECSAMLDQATSFDQPDRFIAELCLKMLLTEEPTLSRLQRLASLCLEQGDPEKALRILQDYQSEVEDPQNSVQKRIDEIKSMPMDVPVLLALLDHVAGTGVTLSAYHPRVARSTKQVIRGTVPSGAWAKYCWIDGQVLEPPTGLARAKRDGSGHAVNYVDETLKDFATFGGEFIPGPVRFLVLVSDKRNDFPVLKEEISIHRAANGDHVERRKLASFIDRVREWAKEPGHQAMMLKWENHE